MYRIKNYNNEFKIFDSWPLFYIFSKINLLKNRMFMVRF